MDGPSFPEFFPQMQDFIQEKKKDSARTSAKKKKKKIYFWEGSYYLRRLTKIQVIFSEAYIV